MNNERKGCSLRAGAGGSSSLQLDHEPRTEEVAASVAVKSVSMRKPQGFFRELPAPAIEMDPRALRNRTRRDFLLFGAGAVAALTGGGFLLPQATLRRMGVRRNTAPGRSGS